MRLENFDAIGPVELLGAVRICFANDPSRIRWLGLTSIDDRRSKMTN